MSQSLVLKRAVVAAVVLASGAVPVTAQAKPKADPYAPVTFTAPYASTYEYGWCYWAAPSTRCSWTRSAATNGRLQASASWAGMADPLAASPGTTYTHGGMAEAQAGLRIPLSVPTGVHSLEVVATYVLEAPMSARASGSGGARVTAELIVYPDRCSTDCYFSDTRTLVEATSSGAPAERAAASTVAITSTFTVPAGTQFPPGAATLRPILTSVASGEDMVPDASSANADVRLESLSVTPRR